MNETMHIPKEGTTVRQTFSGLGHYQAEASPQHKADFVKELQRQDNTNPKYHNIQAIVPKFVLLKTIK